MGAFDEASGLLGGYWEGRMLHIPKASFLLVSGHSFFFKRVVTREAVVQLSPR